MTTSRQMEFLLEILEWKPIPQDTLAYFRERLHRRLHSAILDAFTRRAKERGLKQKDLADRIHKSSVQINRWLSAASNLTLDSISDLMVGLGMDFDAFPFTPIEKTIVTAEQRAEQIALDATIKGIVDKLASQWKTDPQWAQSLSSKAEQAGASQTALPSSPVPKASAASETAEKMQKQTSAGGANFRYLDFQRKAA